MPGCSNGRRLAEIPDRPPRQRPAGGDPARSRRGAPGDPSIADETVAVRRVVGALRPAEHGAERGRVIISAYGRLSRYFDFPVTRAGGTSAITLARPGLRDVIGPLLRQTRDARKRVVVRDIEIRSEYGLQRVELICDPLPDGAMLLVLRETNAFEPAADADLIELDAGGEHVEALEESCCAPATSSAPPWRNWRRRTRS